MYQPSTFGIGSGTEYGFTDAMGLFGYGIPNRNVNVIQELMTNNDMAYGVPYGLQKPNGFGSQSQSLYSYPPLQPGVSPTTPSISPSNSSNSGWLNIIVGPDNMLYMFPYTGGIQYIGKWNPFNNQYSELKTNINSYATNGSVLYQDGFIYSMPYNNATSVLKTDVRTGVSVVIATYPNSNGCNGAVIDPYGYIWSGMQNVNSSTVGPTWFDPRTGKFGTLSAIGSNKYGNPILAPNGKIYFVTLSGSSNTGDIVVVDTRNKTQYVISNTSLTNLITILGGSFTFSNGVVAPNGKIYLIPYGNAGYVVELDPSNDKLSAVGSYFNSGVNGRWGNGCLCPDGMIYAPPTTTNSVNGNGAILRIDWTKVTKVSSNGANGNGTSLIGTGIGGGKFGSFANNWWFDSILHQTGMYFAPNTTYSGGQVMLKMNFAGLSPNIQATLSREVNH